MTGIQSAAAIQIEIKFARADKTYCPYDTVAGNVTVTSKYETKHDGLYLNVDGTVNLQPSKTGVFDAFSTIKPIELSSWSQEIYKSGKLTPGRTDVPFQFTLEPKHNKVLYETYHGIHIAVQYVIKCELKRSFPAKSVAKNGEFLVEYKDQKDKAIEKPITFTITPEGLSSAMRQDCGKFLIQGHIDTCSCVLDRPFSGELLVKHCDKAIKSIELQLFRVETVGSNGDYTKDTTDIQTIQICDGDLSRNLAIPIYMIFPRLFTCPTLETPNFRIEFEISVNIIFADNFAISETFPITLHRY